MKTFIYTLEDPVSHDIRYVGKTNNPEQRYKAHNNPTRDTGTHKRNWINKLRKQGLKPIFKIIDIIEIEDWHFWEKYWICQFKVWGFDLVNYKNGGEGLTFGNQTSFKRGFNPWNKSYTMIKCLNCGKIFHISPSRIEIKKFCCKECYNEAVGKGIIKKKINKGNFKKGSIPWNKGKTYKIKNHE